MSDLNDRDFEFEMVKSKKDQNSKLVIELDYMVEQSEESKSMSDTYVIQENKNIDKVLLDLLNFGEKSKFEEGKHEDDKQSFFSKKFE